MATLNVVQLYKAADKRIKGEPEALLTAALIIIALFCIVVAFSDKAALKGIVVAWMVLP